MRREFTKILSGLLPDPLLLRLRSFWLHLNDSFKLIYGLEPLPHLPNFSKIFPLPSTSTSQGNIYLTILYPFIHGGNTIFFSFPPVLTRPNDR